MQRGKGCPRSLVTLEKNAPNRAPMSAVASSITRCMRVFKSSSAAKAWLIRDRLLMRRLPSQGRSFPCWCWSMSLVYVIGDVGRHMVAPPPKDN
jgi:hypothetical protein